MLNIFKNFNDNNYIIIEKTASLIEDFCNKKLNFIEKNNYNYSNKNEANKSLSGHSIYDNKTKEKKPVLYLSMKNNQDELESQINVYLKNSSLDFLNSIFSNSEYLNIEIMIKDEKDMDIKLNFNYSLISKKVLLSSIDINNEFSDKSFHRFYEHFQSLIIHIGEQKKELESKEKLSSLDFIEIVSENGLIQRFFALTENYEKMFEIRKNHNIEEVFNERDDVFNTHNFYKKLSELSKQNQEIAYKCIFGSNKNIEEMSDLLLINYDIVFKDDFQQFYTDLTQYSNIKILKKKEEKKLKI